MSDTPAATATRKRGKAKPKAEAIEGQARPVDAPEPSRALVPGRSTAPATREVLMPGKAEDVVAGMKAYQDLLPQLLADTDYQDAGGGKRFVKKSGWRKIARAFNLSVEIVSEAVAHDDKGKPLRAECIARAIAPNGQVQDADGYCSIAEFTGQRAGDSKIENTLRATATTRAKNRAISDLVGMGEVSAEEVDVASVALPPWAEPASDELRVRATRAMRYLLADDAEPIWNAIKAELGVEGMPRAVATALLLAISARKRQLAGDTSDQKGEPDATTEPGPAATAADPPDGPGAPASSKDRPADE